MSQRLQAEPQKKVLSPIQFNEMPTIRGRDGLVDFVNDVLGVPISRTRARTAIEARELPVYKIGGCNYFSENDAYLWVKSLARPAVRRDQFGGDAA